MEFLYSRIYISYYGVYIYVCIFWLLRNYIRWKNIIHNIINMTKHEDLHFFSYFLYLFPIVGRMIPRISMKYVHYWDLAACLLRLVLPRIRGSVL